MVSHTLAPTRMIVSKLSTLPVLQQMDQKLRTIRTFSAATQHLLVTAALPAFSSGHGRDLNMSVALRRASRHGSWPSFDQCSKHAPNQAGVSLPCFVSMFLKAC